MHGFHHEQQIESQHEPVIADRCGHRPIGPRRPDLIPQPRHCHRLAQTAKYVGANREKRPIRTDMFGRQYHVTSTRITRSEEHTSELQSLMRNSYAVFCLQKKTQHTHTTTTTTSSNK